MFPLSLYWQELSPVNLHSERSINIQTKQVRNLLTKSLSWIKWSYNGSFAWKFYCNTCVYFLNEYLIISEGYKVYNNRCCTVITMLWNCCKEQFWNMTSLQSIGTKAIKWKYGSIVIHNGKIHNWVIGREEMKNKSIFAIFAYVTWNLWDTYNWLLNFAWLVWFHEWFFY